MKQDTPEFSDIHEIWKLLDEEEYYQEKPERAVRIEEQTV